MKAPSALQGKDFQTLNRISSNISLRKCKCLSDLSRSKRPFNWRLIESASSRRFLMTLKGPWDAKAGNTSQEDVD